MQKKKKRLDAQNIETSLKVQVQVLDMYRSLSLSSEKASNHLEPYLYLLLPLSLHEIWRQRNLPKHKHKNSKKERKKSKTAEIQNMGFTFFFEQNFEPMNVLLFSIEWEGSSS
jgi:hypothetical protein